MAIFKAIRGNNLPILNEHELLYVHCVSKEDFIIIPSGLLCVELKCREIHVSFLDSLDVRRVGLTVPIINGHNKVEDVFKDTSSPALIKIHSSCVLKFFDMNHPRTKDMLMEATILWDYEVLPAPASEPIKPVQHVFVEGCKRDEAFPPVNIMGESSCNCYKQPLHPVCDVGATGCDEGATGNCDVEIEEINQLTEILDVQDSDENDFVEGEDVLFAHCRVLG